MERGMMFTKKELRNTIVQGHALDVLKKFPSNFIDTTVCSPPYYGLRDYEGEPIVWVDERTACGEHEWEYYIRPKNTWGKPNEGGSGKLSTKGSKNFQFVSEKSFANCKNCDSWLGELGFERTAYEFVEHLCYIFGEVYRVTKDTGSLWIVIKDSYGDDKSMLGVPDMLKLKLIQQGWILRNDIIWEKSNSMPSAIQDRFSGIYEHIFFFTKTRKYFFEQQFDPINPESLKRSYHPNKSQKAKADPRQVIAKQRKSMSGNIGNGYLMNKKDVWRMATESWSGKHFAIFPTWLVKIPLQATCPKEICNICGHVTQKKYIYRKAKLRKRKDGEIYIDFLAEFDKKKEKLTPEEVEGGIRLVRTHSGFTRCPCEPNTSRGIALDPFFGRGTVGKVASELGMDFVGIELNKRYVKMAWDYIALPEKLAKFM